MCPEYSLDHLAPGLVVMASSLVTSLRSGLKPAARGILLKHKLDRATAMLKSSPLSKSPSKPGRPSVIGPLTPLWLHFLLFVPESTYSNLASAVGLLHMQPLCWDVLPLDIFKVSLFHFFQVFAHTSSAQMGSPTRYTKQLPSSYPLPSVTSLLFTSYHPPYYILLPVLHWKVKS